MSLPAHTRTLRFALVAAALFGLLLVTHLSLQAQNNFVFGCSGVSGAGTAADSGCDDVTGSRWSRLFGVSQTTLGFLFYGLMALLRLAYPVRRDDRLRLAAFGLSAVGLFYSGFLFYLQAAEIGSFCLLCLGSALTTFVLFVLHFIEHRRLQGVADVPARAARAEPTGWAALRPYVPLLAIFAILLAGDVVLARSGRTAAATPDGPTPSLTAAAQQASQGNAPAATPASTGSCTYDPGIPRIADTAPFTQGPFLGTAGAPVEIIEIYDPNCPHCRDMQEVLDPIVEANRERVRFYPVAFPLRETSLGQVVALEMAQREGKYFELMTEMFRRLDQTWGMTLPEIQASVEAVGMSGPGLATTFQNQMQLEPLLGVIRTRSEAVSKAFVDAQGTVSTPKVAINGRVLAPTYDSYSARCLQQFIDEAAGAPAAE